MRPRTFLVLAAACLLAVGCVKKSTHRKALEQIKTLEGQLADAQTQIKDRDQRIGQLEKDLEALNVELGNTKNLSEEELRRIREEKEQTELALQQLKEQRDQQEKRLAAYKDLQRRFKELVATGALEVQFRNGQMTLKLPSGVLFGSGSADLSEEGAQTITAVTEVLLAFKDRRFLVAGHTDNVPIKTKKFKNNWYLSTARAVSVVEQMIGAGFPASQLAAAGYADKDPVGDNATEEGKQLNRRIEIIMVPDLSELPQLSEEPE